MSDLLHMIIYYHSIPVYVVFLQVSFELHHRSIQYRSVPIYIIELPHSSKNQNIFEHTKVMTIPLSSADSLSFEGLMGCPPHANICLVFIFLKL